MEGGENLIITAEELRLILKAQCEEEDQTVWMTTAQAGFPTTAAKGELDNDLDRQLGKPTARSSQISPSGDLPETTETGNARPGLGFRV